MTLGRYGKFLTRLGIVLVCAIGSFYATQLLVGDRSDSPSTPMPGGVSFLVDGAPPEDELLVGDGSVVTVGLDEFDPDAAVAVAVCADETLSGEFAQRLCDVDVASAAPPTESANSTRTIDHQIRRDISIPGGALDCGVAFARCWLVVARLPLDQGSRQVGYVPLRFDETMDVTRTEPAAVPIDLVVSEVEWTADSFSATVDVAGLDPTRPAFAALCRSDANLDDGLGACGFGDADILDIDGGGRAEAVGISLQRQLDAADTTSPDFCDEQSCSLLVANLGWPLTGVLHDL